MADYEIKDNVCVFNEGVKSIEKNEFHSSSIVDVKLPSTLEAIGSYAFRQSSLHTVTIPGNVKKIGDEAFSLCENLKSVTIEEGVKTIGKLVFYKSAAIQTITLPSTLTKIGNSAFASCKALTKISLPAKLKTIGEYAFEACPLQMIEFAKDCKLTEIGLYAFSLTDIETLELPPSLKKISCTAFDNCKKLKSVTIHEGIERFGDGGYDQFRMFENCVALESINIPASLTDLGYKPFMGCTALKNITVDPANPAYVMKDGKLMTKDLQTQIFPIAD